MQLLLQTPINNQESDVLTIIDPATLRGVLDRPDLGNLLTEKEGYHLFLVQCFGTRGQRITGTTI